MSLVIPVEDLFNNENRSGVTAKHNTWAEITLKDIVTIQNGFAFPSNAFNNTKNGLPLIRIRNVVDGETDTYYSGDYSDSYLVYQGDLLVGMDGDFNSALWKGRDSLLNQRVCRLIPNENYLLKKFLFYGISGYLKKINENTSSVTVKHLSSGDIGKIPFPLPPLAEQKRIVAKLDEAFQYMEILKAKLDRIPQLLKKFRETLLTHAVTEKLLTRTQDPTSNGDWKNVTLDDVCLSITDGDHQAPPQVSVGIPFLVISNVSKGFFDFDSVTRFVKEDYYISLKSSRIPRKGDILYTVTGSYGIPLLVDFEKDFCFQRHIAILKPDTTKITSEFLHTLLSSELILKQAHSVATGTAQLTVPLRGIKGFEFALPTLNEQREISNKVQHLLSKTTLITEKFLLAKKKLNEIPQALLSKAFKGELIPQDGNDEPASELLKRIKEAKVLTKKVAQLQEEFAF